MGRIGPTRQAAVVALAALALAGSASADSFYHGKTVSLTVGFAPGGGMDVPTRIFARYLGKQLPGATVVVRNMPGAGGLIALNSLFERAQRDGTEILFDSWSPMNTITGAEGVKFDYRKFTLITGLKTGPYVMFARKDLLPNGLRDPADIAKVENLVYGGQQPFVPLDLHGRMALTLLGVKFKYVRGYVGAVAIRSAIEKGEANITTHALQGYRAGVEPAMVRDGVVVPLWHFPSRDIHGRYHNNPLSPDMPSFTDVLQRVKPGKPSGIEWEAFELLSALYGTVSNMVWGPPEMNPAAVSEIRRAFVAAANDPESIAEQRKVFGFQYAPVGLEDTRKIIELVENVDPGMRAFYKEFIK